MRLKESRKRGRQLEMRSFKDITEKRGDTAVFTFGRFNPPTTGHEKLIDAIAKQQKKNAGSKMYVFPSHSNDPKKNPLPHSKKVAYMRKMFPKYKGNIVAGKERNVFEVAVTLHNKGHRAVVMVVGSDRVQEFEKLLNTYNGVDGRHGYYGFDNIEVVSAGERDPDSEGVTGMSASKMRAAAADGDFDSFKLGLPASFKDGEKLYRDVRANMGIREERIMGDMNDIEFLRDLFLTGKIWNAGDIVETHSGLSGEIIRKGTNYLTMVEDCGKVHKIWLHEVVLNERNYKKEYQNYHSRPEQIARRSSRNKARRIMGDKTKIGMDVGHKDNNPMNNDPANLRNENPSDNRREPRLRDEAWYHDLAAKFSQITHPRGWSKLVKDYADGMKDPEHRAHPSKWAYDIARNYNGVDGRQLTKYINTLVKKGKLPKELRAEYQPEEWSFKDFVKQIQEDGPQKKSVDWPKKAYDKYKEKFPKDDKVGDSAGKAEELEANASQQDYIDDFLKSDAPQFKGKSKDKRIAMAIAAYKAKGKS